MVWGVHIREVTNQSICSAGNPSLAPRPRKEVFALILQQGSLQAAFPSLHRLDAVMHASSCGPVHRHLWDYDGDGVAG